ncbi:UNVERIFIED_CONTAM: Receptor-like serine/threonine-protein kinase ALE2 [Sesamum latifolium]|uniref:Receptor-like serine/threonine-protein kinase ALE2 n=1 Tax=Sesamum latifolium TaxID=2727402 RepID=A0AAW2Y5E6_9LAMI
MEYSSGPLEELENRPFSASGLVESGVALPIRHGNRSGPLRTIRSNRSFYRLQGSMSEHGGLLGKRAWNDNEYEGSL